MRSPSNAGVIVRAWMDGRLAAVWKGTYSASYVARATTAGSFVRAPAHAEEMYNPAVQGRSDGGRFEVEALPRR